MTAAIHANSIPVAEYTLATILLSLKHAWSLARQTRERRTFVPRKVGGAGLPGTTVVARMTAESQVATWTKMLANIVERSGGDPVGGFRDGIRSSDSRQSFEHYGIGDYP